MISRRLLARTGANSLVGLGLLLAASVPASTQDAPAAATPPSPWLKVCNKNPENNAEVCVVSAEVRAETGQSIAEVTIYLTPEPGKYGFGAVVPIGFVLPPGIVLNVDGTKQGTAPYTICLPPGNNRPPLCVAQTPVSEDFISALKKGNKLSLILVNPQNRQIPIEISLAGFSKTIEGPGIDRAAAEAQRKQLSDALQKSAEEARKKLIEQQQKELGKTAN